MLAILCQGRQAAARRLARPIALLRGDRQDLSTPRPGENGHQRALEGVRGSGRVRSPAHPADGPPNSPEPTAEVTCRAPP